MKNFDLFIELLYSFRTKSQTKKNGQGILSSHVPGSAGGNQNITFLYPMAFLFHVRWKNFGIRNTQKFYPTKFESYPVKLLVSGVRKMASSQDFGDRNNLDCIR